MGIVKNFKDYKKKDLPAFKKEGTEIGRMEKTRSPHHLVISADEDWCYATYMFKDDKKIHDQHMFTHKDLDTWIRNYENQGWKLVKPLDKEQLLKIAA